MNGADPVVACQVCGRLYCVGDVFDHWKLQHSGQRAKARTKRSLKPWRWKRGAGWSQSRGA